MRHFVSFVSMLLGSACLSLTAAANQLAWTPAEMMNLKIISDVQISPSNTSVIFVANEYIGSTSYLSKIYKADTNSHNCVSISSFDAPCSQPRWSPDGQWIAFLSKQEGIKNLYLMRSDGSETRALTGSKKDIQTFAWSPNGKYIAFVMEDETALAKNQKKSSAAYVYKEPLTVNRLWLLDIFDAKHTVHALTTDEHCVHGSGDFNTTQVEFDWSSDSTKIVYAYSPCAGIDAFYADSSLAEINIATGTTTVFEKQARYEAMPRYSPDNKWIAFLINNDSHRYIANSQVAVRSTKNNLCRQLAPTFNEGPFLSGPGLLGWTKDSNHVLFYEPKRTKYHIVLLPVDGSAAQELETGDLFFKDPVLSADKTMLGFVAQSPSQPPEAYISSLELFNPKPISQLNRSFLTLPSSKTETMRWSASDGLQIEGLLTYPLGYQKGKRYPLLLVIHGGPSGVFDETFLGTPNPYPLASFAEAGFLIFRPNPRGSTGYGKMFRSANYGDWGGMDFQDIMAGVDALIAQDIADPNKLGIMGWSYGGYLTAWAITQTKRFKAASIGAAPINLTSISGTTDLYGFISDYLGDFIDNADLHHARSPIYHVRNVNTPCLIQHGTTDKRVPDSQAYELYHALDRAGKNPTLVLYPEMGHRFSDPQMQQDAMERNLAWFQQHFSSKLDL